METSTSIVEISETAVQPPSPPGFQILRTIDTLAATSAEDQLVNIRRNMKLGFPWINKLPEFNKPKGRNKKAALVGGGPSLKDPKILEELRKFKTIFVCGSANDYLMKQGIIPTYAVNCDPDPVCANYFTLKDTETKYLMASSSAPELLDILKDQQIVLWHCHSQDQHEEVLKLEKEMGIEEYYGVGGGCTVGLRTISIAIGLGYTNLHFFGFDSCMDAEGREHHAYEFTEEKEFNVLGQVYKIKIGDFDGPSDKVYYVAGYQLAQAENFKQFFCDYAQYFECTFHGEGLLKDTHRLILDTEKKIAAIHERERLEKELEVA